jgi:thioester reductase-like protein
MRLFLTGASGFIGWLADDLAHGEFFHGAQR